MNKMRGHSNCQNLPSLKSVQVFVTELAWFPVNGLHRTQVNVVYFVVNDLNIPFKFKRTPMPPERKPRAFKVAEQSFVGGQQ